MSGRRAEAGRSGEMLAGGNVKWMVEAREVELRRAKDSQLRLQQQVSALSSLDARAGRVLVCVC